MVFAHVCKMLNFVCIIELKNISVYTAYHIGDIADRYATTRQQELSVIDYVSHTDDDESDTRPKTKEKLVRCMRLRFEMCITIS